MEKEAKINAEKVKMALESLKEVDVDKVMRAFVEILKVYGDLAKRIGVIQRDNKEAFEAITYISSMAPQIMQILAKKAPPAEFGAFIKAFMELLELAPKLDNLMKLSAEEKIEVGERVEKIANTFEEMINKMQEERKKGEE